MKPLQIVMVLLALALPLGVSGGEVTEADVATAIRHLQPAHGAAVAAAWGSVIWEAGVEVDIDPLLLVALAFRESSLTEGVVGTRGELGPMQLHGAALRYRPGRCDPREIECSIRGGAAVLQWWRAECGEVPWSRWVGAYGLGRCPGIDEAEGLQSVRRARALYQRVGGSQWLDE